MARNVLISVHQNLIQLENDSVKWNCVIPPFCLFSLSVFNKILQGELEHPWV